MFVDDVSYWAFFIFGTVAFLAFAYVMRLLPGFVEFLNVFPTDKGEFIESRFLKNGKKNNVLNDEQTPQTSETAT